MYVRPTIQKNAEINRQICEGKHGGVQNAQDR